MCETKPGVRCADATRRVAERTAAAFYEVFAVAAPPLGPSRWTQTNDSPVLDEIAQAYADQLREVKDTSPDEQIALERAQVWREQVIRDAGSATCHSPNVDSPAPEMDEAERAKVVARLRKTALADVRRYREREADAQTAVLAAWDAHLGARRAAVLAQGAPKGGTAHRRAVNARERAEKALDAAMEACAARNEAAVRVGEHENRIAVAGGDVRLTGVRPEPVTERDAQALYRVFIEAKIADARERGDEPARERWEFDLAQVANVPHEAMAG